MFFRKSNRIIELEEFVTEQRQSYERIVARNEKVIAQQAEQIDTMRQKLARKEDYARDLRKTLDHYAKENVRLRRSSDYRGSVLEHVRQLNPGIADKAFKRADG